MCTYLFPKSISQSEVLKIESKHKYSLGLYSRIHKFWEEHIIYYVCIYIQAKANIIKSIKIDKKTQTQYILIGILEMFFFLLFPLYFKSYKYF